MVARSIDSQTDKYSKFVKYIFPIEWQKYRKIMIVSSADECSDLFVILQNTIHV